MQRLTKFPYGYGFIITPRRQEPSTRRKANRPDSGLPCEHIHNFFSTNLPDPHRIISTPAHQEPPTIGEGNRVDGVVMPIQPSIKGILFPYANAFIPAPSGNKVPAFGVHRTANRVSMSRECFKLGSFDIPDPGSSISAP